MENIQVIDFDNLQKKKKKVVKKAPESETTASNKETAQSQESVEKPENRENPSEIKDFFSYEALLGRINEIMRNNHAALGDKPEKFIMKPPSVVKVPGKRSAWVNFADICNSLKRPLEHVSLFFLTELGTEGSVAGEQLILKGKYSNQNIETEYVCCHSCKSGNTEMTRDSNTRLYMMKCNACQSTRSVASIKAGFTAVKQGDRKKEKNK